MYQVTAYHCALYHVQKACNSIVNYDSYVVGVVAAARFCFLELSSTSARRFVNN